MDEMTPTTIYVWLVPSEVMLEQPGSWRIRKWDTEPFPEGKAFVVSETPQNVQCPECEIIFDAQWREKSGKAPLSATRDTYAYDRLLAFVRQVARGNNFADRAVAKMILAQAGEKNHD
jgi:hypothetical protein